LIQLRQKLATVEKERNEVKAANGTFTNAYNTVVTQLQLFAAANVNFSKANITWLEERANLQRENLNLRAKWERSMAFNKEMRAHHTKVHCRWRDEKLEETRKVK